MAGLLGRTFQDDPGAVGMGGGGLLGPMTGAQKAAMLFAGLRDAVGNFSGRPTENLNSLADQYAQMNYRQMARQDRLDDRKRDDARYEQGRKDKMTKPLSPERVAALGYRPGTVLYEDGLGNVQVGQQSDVKSSEAIQQQIELDRGKGIMSPEEMQQRLRIAAAGRSSAGMGPVVIQPGAQLVDRRTGQPLYTAPKKPMPASLQKLESEDIDAIQTGRAISKDLGKIREQIQTGELTLGPVSNIAAEAMNYTGMSNPNSRRIATLKATLEKQRNDSLRLNKGVQTEGDAQRAWNEVMKNLNDPRLVSERLAEIEAINERGASFRAFQLNQRRRNYGVEEFDETQLAPEAIIGGTGTTGANSLSPQEQAELDALRARFKGR